MEEKKRILIVDDEESIRQLLSEILISQGFETETAKDGFEAIAKLELEIDLVLMDVMMPLVDGFEATRMIRDNDKFSTIPIIMVTALDSKDDRLKAIKIGANDFITKPFDMQEISIRVRSLLKLKEAQDELKKWNHELEAKIETKTNALRVALENMADAHRKTNQAYLETIQRLSFAAEYKDKDTATHINRMSRISQMLALKVGMTMQEIEMIRIASPMHDIGKIGIPDKILLKPGKLESTEWEIMRQHPTIGGRILEGSSSELLQEGEVIAKSHHERWDGKGYPSGLEGDEIPLTGRICAVADVFDALTSERPYKNAIPNKDAIEIIVADRGKHFDPMVVDKLTENIKEVEVIQEEANGPLEEYMTNH